MFLWAVYIFPGSVCLFCCRKKGGPNLGIYRSLTDTWMWKLGLRPAQLLFWEYINRNFFAVHGLHCTFTRQDVRQQVWAFRPVCWECSFILVHTVYTVCTVYVWIIGVIFWGSLMSYHHAKYLVIPLQGRVHIEKGTGHCEFHSSQKATKVKGSLTQDFQL